MTIKEDRLESKVLIFPKGAFKQDKNGTYFPFCNYGFHRGLILNENVCQTRNCNEYLKIYIRYGEKK